MVKQLLALNGLAISATLINHAHGWVLVSMFLWAHTYRSVDVPNFDQVGSISYFIMRILEQLVVFGIAAFLVISGFFVAVATKSTESTVRWRVIFSRLKFILIPYLLWVSFILFMDVFLEGKAYTPAGILNDVITGAIRGPYYYVPMLVQFFILAPFLVPLARNRAKVLVVITTLIQVIALILLYAFVLRVKLPLIPMGFHFPGWLFPSRIFWFAGGLILGFHLPELKPSIISLRWVFLALMIVFLIIGIWEWEAIFFRTNFLTPLETLVDSLYAFCFLMFFLSLGGKSIPLSESLSKLGIASFGIYLAHVPAQEYTARIMYHFTPGLLEFDLFFFLIILLVGLFIPLGLMWCVNWLPIRRYYRYIFG